MTEMKLDSWNGLYKWIKICVKSNIFSNSVLFYEIINVSIQWSIVIFRLAISRHLGWFRKKKKTSWWW